MENTIKLPKYFFEIKPINRPLLALNALLIREVYNADNKYTTIAGDGFEYKIDLEKSVILNLISSALAG